MKTIRTEQDKITFLDGINQLRDKERSQHNIACTPVLAIFYDASGKEVWSCKKDMRYHFAQGTKAMNKGAVRGVLVNLNGDKIDEAEYRA